MLAARLPCVRIDVRIDARIDAPEAPPSEQGTNGPERDGIGSPQPRLECIERGHRSRKDLRGPRAINLGLCPSGHIPPVVVAAGSPRYEQHAASALAQLDDVSGALQVQPIGVEPMNEITSRTALAGIKRVRLGRGPSCLPVRGLEPQDD